MHRLWTLAATDWLKIRTEVGKARQCRDADTRRRRDKFIMKGVTAVADKHTGTATADGTGARCGERSAAVRCPHADWRSMLKDHHAFATALHHTGGSYGHVQPTCSFGTLQLYNQVSLRWRRDDMGSCGQGGGGGALLALGAESLPGRPLELR